MKPRTSNVMIEQMIIKISTAKTMATIPLADTAGSEAEMIKPKGEVVKGSLSNSQSLCSVRMLMHINVPWRL